MYRSPTQVNERHGAGHYSPSPPRRAGAPGPPQILCRGERARLALARETPRRHKWIGNGCHVFAHSTLRRLPLSFPSFSPCDVNTRPEFDRWLQTDAWHPNPNEINVALGNRQVIVIVYDIRSLPVYRSFERTRTKCIIIYRSTLPNGAHRIVISRASRRPGFADSIVSGLRRGRERQPASGVVGKGATRIYR